jgi:hypothetical protein
MFMLNFFRKLYLSTFERDVVERGDFAFADKLLQLENKIKELEYELYECECRMESKIDKIHPIVYNIQERNS